MNKTHSRLFRPVSNITITTERGINKCLAVPSNVAMCVRALRCVWRLCESLGVFLCLCLWLPATAEEFVLFVYISVLFALVMFYFTVYIAFCTRRAVFVVVDHLGLIVPFGF